MVKARKHPKSVYLFLTIACQDLITREDFDNVYKTKTFTITEVTDRIDNHPNSSIILKLKKATELKYLVLALRDQFHRNLGNIAFASKWRLWVNEAKELGNYLERSD